MIEKIPFQMAKTAAAISAAVTPEQVVDQLHGLVASVMQAAPPHCGRKEQIGFAARALSLPYGLIESLWYRKRPRPTADEFLTVVDRVARVDRKAAAILEQNAQTTALIQEARRADVATNDGRGAPVGVRTLCLAGEQAGRDGDKTGALGGQNPQMSDAARRLLLACGNTESTAIGIEAADPRHRRLIEAWAASGGELSAQIVSLIDGMGLAERTSLYHPGSEIKIRHLGPDSVFWSAEERAAAVGKPLLSLTGPRDLSRAANDTLTAALLSGAPALGRAVFTGARRFVWDRLALSFPASGVIVGCVCVPEGV